MNKIKFIWDFRGYDSEKTAEHHAVHLREFSEKHNLDGKALGNKMINEMYSISYMISEEDKSDDIRKALRPHREEFYHPEN